MGSVSIIICGWVIDKRTILAGPVVTLFSLGIQSRELSAHSIPLLLIVTLRVWLWLWLQTIC
jgi:hypothetical protein